MDTVMEQQLMAIGSLPISPTSRYVAQTMIVAGTTATARLSTLTGLPERTIQRAKRDYFAAIGGAAISGGKRHQWRKPPPVTPPPVADKAPPVAETPSVAAPSVAETATSGGQSCAYKDSHAIMESLRDSSSEVELKKKKNKTLSSDSEFDAWYDAYPRHEGRGQALRAYRTARKKADAATLLAGAQQARGRYADREKRYIPLPATWLNGERWLDEPEKTSERKSRLGLSQKEYDDLFPPEIYRALQ